MVDFDRYLSGGFAGGIESAVELGNQVSCVLIGGPQESQVLVAGVPGQDGPNDGHRHRAAGNDVEAADDPQPEVAARPAGNATSHLKPLEALT